MPHPAEKLAPSRNTHLLGSPGSSEAMAKTGTDVVGSGAVARVLRVR